MDLIKHISVNILIVVATIVSILVGIYLMLLLFDWVMKMKSGRREQEGLSAMLVDSMAQKAVADKSVGADGGPEARVNGVDQADHIDTADPPDSIEPGESDTFEK